MPLNTMYHPYCHSPGTLTKYLKLKLRSQRAKRLGHSLPAQVEPSVQLERNKGINKQTRVMNNPMSWTMLFFGYLRGPKMHLWIKKISAQLDQHLHTGGRDTDEWIWDTMINDFAQNFQDVMSQERAEKKLFELKMERGELDEYTSQFQQLAKLAGYYEQTGMICR